MMLRVGLLCMLCTVAAAVGHDELVWRLHAVGAPEAAGLVMCAWAHIGYMCMGIYWL